MTSRSLLEGIFTVSRMDFGDSSGEFGEERDTVTVGEEGMSPVVLRRLDIMLDGVELEALIKVERERRERRGAIMLSMLGMA